jgi:metal transporter CNNM
MHNLKYHFAKKVQEPLDPVEFWIILAACGVLVILGGIFAGNSLFNYAGLTIGLMSLDSTNIQILKASGSERERIYAERIEPIRKSTHILLVTLLLANTIVNETLPVLFHVIHLDGYQAVLISTALIVIFGEIIPQAGMTIC